MKTEKVKEFRNEIQEWLNFNKSRGQINLLDLSNLLRIIRKYYILRIKKEFK